MAAKGNGRNLRGWAGRRRRARSFLYESLPQTAPRPISSWFFEGPPIGDAGGIGTASGVSTSIVASAGTSHGASTATAGVTSPLSIGTAAIRQKVYHDPFETTSGGTLTTWDTDATFLAADVTTATDVIELGVTHNMVAGAGPFRMTTTDTLPAPLAVATSTASPARAAGPPPAAQSPQTQLHSQPSNDKPSEHPQGEGQWGELPAQAQSQGVRREPPRWAKKP